MISWKSAWSFISINSIVCGLNWISNKIYDTLPIAIIPCEVAKHFFLVYALETYNDKPRIQGKEADTVTTRDFILYTSSIGVMKGILNLYLYSLFDEEVVGGSSSIVVRFLTFAVKSFAFEVLFDLMHYGAHRYIHENKNLYRLYHKTHHNYANPSAKSTFIIHPIDYILSNSIPVCACAFIFRRWISRSEFSAITIYLTYQEVGGHLGLQMYPTSSFSQFVWLPKIFNIQMYTEDHNLHHTHFNYNYSKRFVIWDKLCGTYKKPLLIRANSSILAIK